MNVQDDRMWAEVLEAHTPNAAEMAEAEAELQALGDVAPLPAADVEALVELAVKTPPVVVEGRGVIGRVVRSRRFHKPLLQAAAAVLLLMAVAWVAQKMAHREERDADVNLDYGEAVLLATERGRTDGAYASALWIIAAECGKAAETLRYLADQVEYPTLRDQARLISKELVRLLTNGPSAPSGDIDGSLKDLATIAADTRLGVDVRQRALDRVRDLAKSGLTAVMLAELPRKLTFPRALPIGSDEAFHSRINLINRLLRVLPRAD